MTTIRFADVRAWVFDQALPFWSETGVDRAHGGFVERLTLDGTDAAASFKRTRVQARQIYCFSHAALLGWTAGAEVSDFGWRHLMDTSRVGEGGWVRRTDRRGGVIDATCDAYDMAFVLLAHAWRHRLTGDARVLEGALATVAALDERLRHSSGLGWLAHDGDVGPRQQNPHMHLVEAALELADTTGHPRFYALANEVASLFTDRILDGPTGVLREYFTADWGRLRTPQGRLVEPGHQLEWVWILHRAQPILGRDFSSETAALYHSAEARGVDAASGLTWDEIDEDGRVLSRSSRAWPQTEALKANLSMFEHGGLDTRIRIAQCVDNLLEHYLAPAPAGAWIDKLDGQGRPEMDNIPASTFYHLLLAFMELLRLEPRLSAVR